MHTHFINNLNLNLIVYNINVVTGIQLGIK
jgi:hypothetical protein